MQTVAGCTQPMLTGSRSSADGVKPRCGTFSTLFSLYASCTNLKLLLYLEPITPRIAYLPCRNTLRSCSCHVLSNVMCACHTPSALAAQHLSGRGTANPPHLPCTPGLLLLRPVYTPVPNR